MKYLTEPLAPEYDKGSFSCGKDLLDNYLWRQAKQDVKRKLSACFVMIDRESSLISGYYTLSGNSIPNELIPETFRKKLPGSYVSVPAILLGRLAIDKKFQGRGLGKVLLIDALRRSHDASHAIGAFAVVVDPIDTEAERFYAKYGFIKLHTSGKMFIPMKTVMDLFG
mgnify:CR=1 FL=1